MTIRRALLRAALLSCPAVATAQSAPPAAPEWPAIAPARVLETPDWSDYRQYPEDARRRNQEGSVRAKILIGTDGRPSACRIIDSSGFAELDAGTCERLLTMRFEPPRDKTGRPLTSSFQRSIGWLLQDARPFGSSRIAARLHRGDDGQIACLVTNASGAYARIWLMIACSAFADAPHFLHAATPADRDFVIVTRLDAGDGALDAQAAWPQGAPIAAQMMTFAIGGSGDPEKCKPTTSHGFGPQGLNNLSPCGRLLSALWIKDAKGRSGLLETRVYRVAPDPDRDAS